MRNRQIGLSVLLRLRLLYGMERLFIAAWAVALSVRPKEAIARASDRGTDNRTAHAFFMSLTEFCLEQSKVTI